MKKAASLVHAAPADYRTEMLGVFNFKHGESHKGNDVQTTRQGLRRVFHANSFDEMAEMSKQHAVKMLHKKDAAHIRVMDEMPELMKNPEAMKQWFESKKQEFESSFEG